MLISEHVFLSLLLNLCIKDGYKIFKMLSVLSNLQKDTNSPFNTIEDSGIDAKFVNVVYDALLNTVSREKEFMFYTILYQTFSQMCMISEESLKTYFRWSHENCHRILTAALVKEEENFPSSKA